MATCPTCRKKFPDDVSACPDDDVALLPDEAFAAADETLKPGATVRDYRIEKVLGRGSYGEVYAAEHPLIGRRAAVKVLHRKFSSEPEIVSRFIAEARAVNKIRHRNIIDVFDFGQLDDERQYLVMELLEGETLGELLARQGRLSFAEARPILEGVANALDAAHAEGIAHRDLKPDNIFIAKEKDGTIVPKLLDFGVAKLTDDDHVQHKTATGVAMGTPLYMSPEQARGKGVGTSADIYAFGVLVFRILSGRFPFGAESVVELLGKVISQPAPPLSTKAPDLGTVFDEAVARMLAKHPADRPARAGQALAELSAAVGAEDAGRESGELGKSWDETVKLGNAEDALTDEARARLKAFEAKDDLPKRAARGEASTRVPAAKNTANMDAPPPEAVTPPAEAYAATQAGTLDAVSRERTADPHTPRRTGLVVGGVALAVFAVGAFILFQGGGDTTAPTQAAPSVRATEPMPSLEPPSADPEPARDPEPAPATTTEPEPSASASAAALAPPAVAPKPVMRPRPAVPRPAPAVPKPAPKPEPGGIDGDIFKRD